MVDLRELDVAAFSAQRAGRYREAIAKWQAVLDVVPGWEDGYGYYSLAYCYCELGDFDNAKAAYQRAIEVDSSNSHFTDGLGSLIEARRLGHI